MMTLEEYILKRKKEDGIREYDLDKRTQNIQICINYIFEYFNNYLDADTANETTILHEQKNEKYKKMLRDYDNEIQEWLVFLYSSHGKFMHKYLLNFINDTYFLLYDSEAEFRALSYEIYPKAIKKFKFLEGQSEMIFLFIKDAHKVKNQFSERNKDICICESIDDWINDTYRKYNVNIYNFCDEWIDYFYEYPDIWPRSHKHKSKNYDEYSKHKVTYESLLWDYDYKQKSNLFGLDALYRDMPKKPFIRGKKQYFESIMMYCWLHSIVGDHNYWNTYLDMIYTNL